MLALHDWQNFYMLTGTAAATLIGLLFVAVSIGLNVPVKQVTDSLQTFVTPTLIYYFQALLVSCVAIMPLLSPLIFGGALAILGGFNIVLALRVFWRIRIVHRDDGIDLVHLIWHCLLPLTAGLLFLGTAIGFLLGESLAPLGLSIAELLCLTIGLRNTWDLMIWLSLRRAQEHESASNGASYEEKIERRQV